MTRRRTTTVPLGNTATDRRNFTLDDYVQMCRDGEATFSIAEAARLTGVSRAFLYRCLTFASIPSDEFEAVLDDMYAGGSIPTTTAIADEIKRRTGKARQYHVRCPHCHGVLYTRNR